MSYNSVADINIMGLSSISLAVVASQNREIG